MKRSSDIEALLKRARATNSQLINHYQSSLKDKVVSADLRIDIKNIFENLRSCLDYIAHDVSEYFCSGVHASKFLYFPIRLSNPDFIGVMKSDFPGLDQKCPGVFNVIELVQPYNDGWLGQFNDLNNGNKHQSLSEQTRKEARHVNVQSKAGHGNVSWGPGVTFGAGVKILGVSVDPKTQLPVANNQVETHVTVWIDFTFSGTSTSVLPFISHSIDRVESLFKGIVSHF